MTDGNDEIENSFESDTYMEYFPKSDCSNSNSKSEYFAAISSTIITNQPYPQMNFCKNTKISNAINGKTAKSTRNDEKQKNHLSISKHQISLRLELLKQFYIRQDSNAIDTFLGFLRKNRYVIEDSSGKLVISLHRLSFISLPFLLFKAIHRNV
uniref:DEP domain-containing protein n=1 Tax=Elaeophora elaphi TaxID=1147741 RepID=A0A0R3S1J0_9BILA